MTESAVPTWADVTAQAGFAELSWEDQETVRQQYFKDVVATRAPSWALDDLRSAFDADTAIPKPPSGLAALPGKIGQAADWLGGEMVDAAAAAGKASMAPVAAIEPAGKPQPRGLRNNNLLNLTTLPGGGPLPGRDLWDGELSESDGRFARFALPEQGIRAAAKNLQRYQDKHGLNTVAGIIGRWAPASENDTGSYAANVARDLGVDPNQPIDLHDRNTLAAMIDSMGRVENGGHPFRREDILKAIDGQTLKPDTEVGRLLRAGFGAPIRPEAIQAVRAGFDLASPKKRQNMMERDDWIGWLARDWAGVSQVADEILGPGMAEAGRRVYRGEVPSPLGSASGIKEPWYAPAQMGFEQGQQMLSLLPAELGLSTPDPVESAVGLADAQRRVERYEPNQDDQDRLQAIQQLPFGEWLKALPSNPDVIARVILQSAGMTAPALAAAGLGGVIAGPAGTAAGAGLGSLAVEYASSLTDHMRKRGLDPNDPRSWQQTLADPAAMAEARSFAAKRAVPVALFDALSAGLAGKLLKGAAATVPSIAARSAGELGVQAGSGAAGEFGAQLAAGQPIDPKDIAMEVMAEVPSALVEVPANFREAGQPSPQERLAQEARRQSLDAWGRVTDSIRAGSAAGRDRPVSKPVLNGVPVAEAADVGLPASAQPTERTGVDAAVRPEAMAGTAEQPGAAPKPQGRGRGPEDLGLSAEDQAAAESIAADGELPVPPPAPPPRAEKPKKPRKSGPGADAAIARMTNADILAADAAAQSLPQSGQSLPQAITKPDGSGWSSISGVSRAVRQAGLNPARFKPVQNAAGQWIGVPLRADDQPAPTAEPGLGPAQDTSVPAGSGAPSAPPSQPSNRQRPLSRGPSPSKGEGVFTPTHVLPGGERVIANRDDAGKPIRNEWIDADGALIEDDNATPIPSAGVNNAQQEQETGAADGRGGARPGNRQAGGHPAAGGEGVQSGGRRDGDLEPTQTETEKGDEQGQNPAAQQADQTEGGAAGPEGAAAGSGAVRGTPETGAGPQEFGPFATKSGVSASVVMAGLKTRDIDYVKRGGQWFGVVRTAALAGKPPEKAAGEGARFKDIRVGDVIVLRRDADYASAGEPYRVEAVSKTSVHVRTLDDRSGTSIKDYYLRGNFDFRRDEPAVPEPVAQSQERETVEKPAVSRPTQKDEPKPENKPSTLEQKPAASEKEPVADAKMAELRAEMDDALADLGAVFLEANIFAKKAVPSELNETKLMPVLARVMDIAFRMGYHRFKQNARFVLATIREKFGDAAADALTIDHVSGAYIVMAGKYRDQGADSRKDVIAIETLDEIYGQTDGEVNQNGQSAGAGERPGDGEVHPLGEPAGETLPGGREHGVSGEGESGREPDGGVLEGAPAEDVPGAGAAEADAQTGGSVGVQGGRGGRRKPPKRNPVAGQQGAGQEGVVSDGPGDLAQPTLEEALTPESVEDSVDRALVDGGGQTRPSNFHLTDPDSLIGGTPKRRFARNKAAIETYNALVEEGRQPTPEEQETLAAYIGWGSFGQELFQGSWEHPVYRDGWKDENDWLREHLGKAAWQSAQASIINAHYTDPPTVKAMWDMAVRLGFQGGRVLEPSMGVGNFFALMPRNLMEKSDLTGIEMDRMTGGIARFLYPDVNIQIKPYQDSKTADGFYDLVIGNWPFDKDGPADRRYNKLNPSLHDYFFLKALDQVRPGGLVIGITSAGTMDKKGRMARAAMAEKAWLVGSFRLPMGAFEQYAGTKVVTDIIVLQKKGDGVAAPVEQLPWLASEHGIGNRRDGGEVVVNEYWTRKPGNVLGTMKVGSGTTQGRDGMIVERHDDFGAVLATLAERLPENILPSRGGGKSVRYITNNTQERQNSVVVGEDGGIYVVQGERLAALEDIREYRVKDAKKTAARVDQIKRLVGIGKAYGALLDGERSGAENVEDLRADLRRQYESFAKDHGPLSESFGLSILDKVDDPMYPAIAALESAREQDGKTTYSPAAILSRSTMRAPKRLEKPGIRDAFVLVRNEDAEAVDVERIAELSGQPVQKVIDDLTGAEAIFKTPAGNYEVRDIYLAGNVRRKLREALDAKQAGQDMERNIEALKSVLPPTVPYFAIEANLGASWILPTHYRQFIADLLNVTGAEMDDIEVERTPNGWRIALKQWLNHKPEARGVWGTDRYPFSRTFRAAINGTSIVIKYKDEYGKYQTDEEASALANEKAQRIREEFSEWVWRDSARRLELEASYNEVMNSIADPQFDGSFLTFDGMALQRGDDPFGLRKHQQDAIWRGVANGRGLYAHEVGTGKTLTMGGICVESRRYGIAKKPMILAHNANSASVAAEIQQMYPGAKVLYIDNLTPATVKAKMYQIANDDWDAIVVPHSLINRFALTRETLDAMTAEEIMALEEEAIAAAAEDGVTLTVGDMDDEKAMRNKRSVTAKELVKMRNAIIKKNEEMAQRASREDSISFEHLGIDMLLIDEVHEFKKPPLVTRRRLKGLNTETSGESLSLHLLSGYVRKIRGGKGVHTFTGTPITNTLNEIYNQMRYVMAEDMDEAGVRDWDSWFNVFAGANTDVELTPTGEYEATTRLSAFINVAELRRMAGQYMHIVFADDMPEFRPRQTASGKTNFDPDLSDEEKDEILNGRTDKPIGRPYKKVINASAPMSPEQSTVMARLVELARMFKRATKLERKRMMNQGHPAIPILVESNAAKAGFDVRRYNLSGEDHPDSKVNRAIANVMRHYHEHPESTQVIFMDTGYEDFTQRSQTRDGITRRWKEPAFNIAKDIINKLVAQGVPREQIATVTGNTSKEKRKEIADAMNRSEIRVVIGGTQTLGVGVNMQVNLRAMHHLDAPWMPGELEQRNGRGHRQGNKWNTVFEYRYLTEGIDGRRWQVLAIKQKFITAFLKATGDTRVIEGDAVSLDEGENIDDLAESLSAAAGDPRILIREKLKADVDKLQRKQRMHDFGVKDARERAANLTDHMGRLETTLEKARDDALHWENERQKPFSIVLNGKTYSERKDADEAIKHLAKDFNRASEGERIGEFRGFEIRGRLTFDGTAELIAQRAGVVYTNATLASLEGNLRNLARRAESIVGDIGENQRSIASLNQAAETPFSQAETLKKKKEMLDQVSNDIEKYPVPAPAWMRDGAPVGTDAFLPAVKAAEPDYVPGYGWMRPMKKGDDSAAAELVDGYGWMVPANQTGNAPAGARKVAIQGHRWGLDDWYVLVDDGEKANRAIPYTDLMDENNMPVFAVREFEKPAVGSGAPSPAAAVAPATTRTPNGIAVGDRVTDAEGGEWTVTRVTAPADGAMVSRTAAWRVEAESDDGSGLVARADLFTLAKAGSGSLESRGGMSGSSSAAVGRRELRRAFGADFARLDEAGLVRIVAAPPGVAADVSAQFDPKTGAVTLYFDRIGKGQWVGKFLHEAGVHQFLPELIGPDRFASLTGEFRRLLDAGDRSAALVEAHVQGLLEREELDPAHADEERIAYSVELAAREKPESLTAKFRLWLRQVKAALRAWLWASPHGRAIVKALGRELKLSNQDLAALARAAVRKGARQERPSPYPLLEGEGDLAGALAAYSREFGVSAAQLRQEFDAVVLRHFGSMAEYDALPAAAGKNGLKAPNGEPTRLNKLQWVMVRTPRFKAWFGDWEGLENRNFLDGNPIASMSGDEVPRFEKLNHLAHWIGEHWNAAGGSSESPILGRVTLDYHAASSSIAHGMSAIKGQAFYLVPRAIEKGRVLGQLEKGDPTDPDAFLIGAPVKIGNRDYKLYVEVRRDANIQRMYVHEAVLRRPLETFNYAAASSETKAEPRIVMPGAIRKLAQLVAAVNPETVSKVVDENGEPRVVYHGTAADIARFDPLALAANTGAGSAKSAYFAAKSPLVASGYAILSTSRPDLRLGMLRNVARSDILPESLRKFVGEYAQGIERGEVEADWVNEWEGWTGPGLRAAVKGANVLPLFVNLRNPMVIDYQNKEYRERSFKSALAEARRNGHDGVVFKNAEDSMHKDFAEFTDVFAVFEPSQLKSATGNTGEFSTDNADINHSRDSELLEANRYYREMGVESPFFRRWFGASKIKSGGRPLVVYHGSNLEPEFFDRAKLGDATRHETAQLGFFFAVDQGGAREYAAKAAAKRGGRATTSAYYLRIEQPYVVTSELLHERMAGLSPQAFREKLGFDGFDGIYIKDAGYVVAFRAEQVKSTENFGTFDPEDKRTRYSRGEIPSPPTPLPGGEGGRIDPVKKGRVRRAWSKLTDAQKSSALGGLTRDQLAVIAHDLLPQMEEVYLREARRADGTRNEVQSRLGTFMMPWASMARRDPAEAGRLASLMHEATVAGVDPARNYVAVIDIKAGLQEIRDIQAKAATMKHLSPDDAARMVQIKSRIRQELNRRPQYARLRELYDALGQEAKVIYRAARSFHEWVGRQTLNGLIARIEETEAAGRVKAELIAKLRLEFEQNKVTAPYFPLARFGAYWLHHRQPAQTVMDIPVRIEPVGADGFIVAGRGAREFAEDLGRVRGGRTVRGLGRIFPNAKRGQVEALLGSALTEKRAYQEPGESFVEFFETEADQLLYMEQMRAEGASEVYGGKRFESFRQIEGVSGQFVADVEGLVKEMGDGPELRQLQDDIWQLYLKSMPDLSARKHLIHRKKRAGYSEDALRASTEKGFHDSYALARLQHMHRLERVMEDMKRSVEAAENPKRLDRLRADLARWSEYQESRGRLDLDAIDTRLAELRRSENAGFDVADELAKWLQFRRWFQQAFNPALSIARAQEQLAGAERIIGRGQEAVNQATRYLEELQGFHALLSSPEMMPSWVRMAETGTFVAFLGGVPMAAMVNMLQTTGIAMPVAGAKYGAAKATGAFLRAMRQFFGSPHLTLGASLRGEELRAFREFQRMGIIDKTLSHDLAGVAEEGIDYSSFRYRAMGAVSFFFHHAERFNREVTAMAVYRLARAAGESENEAFWSTVHLVDRTHGNYEAVNRARFMRGVEGRIAFKFMQYPQFTTFLLLRSFNQAFNGASQAQRAEARKALGGILLMQGLVSGVYGLPWLIGAAGGPAALMGRKGLALSAGALGAAVGGPVGAIAGALAGGAVAGWKGAGIAGTAALAVYLASQALGDPDDPEDWEPKLRTALARGGVKVAEAFGLSGEAALQAGGQAELALWHGMLDLLTGWSWSSGTGMTELWVHTPDRDLTGEQAADWVMLRMLGASGGWLHDEIVGGAALSQGLEERDPELIARAIERMAPRAVRSVLRAYRFAAEGGKAKTVTGATLVDDLSAWEIGGQALGFTPARLANRYELNTAVANLKARLAGRRGDLIERMARALEQKDMPAFAAARTEAEAFVKKNAGRGFGIGLGDVAGSVRQRQQQRTAEGGLPLPRKQAGLRDLYRFGGE